MRLRVFSNSAGNLLVEISHPESKSTMKWFLPMLPSNHPALANLDPAIRVSVKFAGTKHQIPFYNVRTIGVRTPHLDLIGHLENEDSVNVMNNVYDVMAWD
jgi:hypothetical protein